MASYNHITLLGNCTRDPELRYSGNGTAICQIGLAVNHITGTGDTRKQDVCYIDVTCFQRLAEIAAEYLSKGSQVLIAGRLEYRAWESQDGMKRSKHSVIAETLQLMGKETTPVTPGPGSTPEPIPALAAKPRPQAATPKSSRTPLPVDPNNVDEDDIPFVRSDLGDGLAFSLTERRKFMA